MIVQKSVHEPDEQLMSATDVWNDALNLAEILRRNLLRSEPMVRLQIPFSLFLSSRPSVKNIGGIV